jgi:hypothetical protein
MPDLQPWEQRAPETQDVSLIWRWDSPLSCVTAIVPAIGRASGDQSEAEFHVGLIPLCWISWPPGRAGSLVLLDHLLFLAISTALTEHCSVPQSCSKAAGVTIFRPGTAGAATLVPATGYDGE